MYRNDLWYLAHQVREAIKKEEQVEDLKGYEDVASLTLFSILKDYYSQPCQMIWGFYEGDLEYRGHFWVEVNDYRIDVTKSSKGFVPVVDYHRYHGKKAFSEYGVYFSQERANRYIQHINLSRVLSNAS